MEYDFEGVIEKLLKQQGKTKKSLYDYLGLTRQGFDNKLKNRTVSVLELSTIARYFDTTEINLIAVLANRASIDETAPKKNGDYLQEHIINLEESFKRLSERFENELSAKNQQIAGLHRMLESVLGKSEGATLEPLSPEAEKFEEQLREYKDLMRNPFRRKTLHKFQSGAKSVARR